MKASSMKYTHTLLTALLLAPLAALQAAEVPVGTDTRLHADGKGWWLDKAKITDLYAASVPCGLDLPANEAAATPKGEPTNAAEAAAKKAKADAVIEDRYQALVAKLPPEQQAWEKTLQQQLGGFYLPIHKKEKIAGRSTAWDFVQDDPKLPRVLLIGDSVSRGYTQAARKALTGKANVHRAPANCGPTASGLKNIDVWLGDGKWDVIHFNFGIHDRATPIDDYQLRLGLLIERMTQTGAKLIWASSTPCPDTKDGKYKSAPILERNTAAAGIMKKNGIPTDDLFSAITPHLATMQNPDDVHFNAQGYDFLGAAVAKAIEEQLPKW
jgi:hypothetical protein